MTNAIKLSRLRAAAVVLTAGVAAGAALPMLPALGQQGPTAPASPNARPAMNRTPPIAPDSSLKPAFDAERAGDYEKAAELLRPFDPHKMNEVDQRRWRIMAKNVAVRTGDRALLERANKGFMDRTHFVSGREIMNAYELFAGGLIDDAKATLDRVIEPEYLDERSRRRYLALRARIAQMEGDVAQERNYVAKLVDYAGNWRTPACQECHENPAKYGADVVSLDVKNWWAGQRFSELIARTGATSRVTADARRRLKENPADEGPRLRLAYALRAAGDPAACERELRRLAWADFPDRPYKTPVDLITFP